ncbi:unnamed protein product [Prunus armeniaca]|uniref:Reverse transcriptase zinc-binding domain-containing protein n=1 Tax=Prunus armeniaca TaxID=36596 RepID=A0A6J5VDL2_PRUAR|nr:unnamed protein product [Prunus armeniaca]
MPRKMDELIDHTTKQWREDVIRLCFNPDEAKHILSITISRWGCPNKLIWHFSKHEGYVVKSSYELARHLQCNGELGHKGGGEMSSTHGRNDVWPTLSSLVARPKIRAFV